jgi:hypothetical protein
MSNDQATTLVQPLAGRGLVTRQGELLLICADTATGVDDLLALLRDVAAAGADGSVLVRRVAALLANDFNSRIAACAVTGPTSDGRLAVLVYGSATAHIIGGDGEISLSGADAITSVDRLVAGPIVQLRLQLPGAGGANPRTRLEAGVVEAAGILAVAAPATLLGPAEPAETPPAEASPAEASPAEASPEDVTPVADGPAVLGVSCASGHFNDPSLSFCAVCGAAMTDSVVTHEAPRPAVGTLLLDDGTSYPLDVDYLLGREPEPDPDVIGGRVRPLRIIDPEGLVSRRHVRIALSGWQAQVIDLGSANGTTVQRAGEAPEGLPPNLPVMLTPGTVVSLGRRWFRYEAVRQPDRR